MWTIQGVLEWTQGYFAQRGIESARLDAELLLAYVLGVDRVYLYTHYDQPLKDIERASFRGLVKRRAAREPVAYILGEREFYSRTFKVSPAVLIPRPETEHLVEAALGWLQDVGAEAPRILDIGTGSGALAVTLAAECPDAHVTATDISGDALQVAAANAELHGVSDRITFLQGDLFAALGSVGGEREAKGHGDAVKFDIVVSNPPYVEDTPAERAALQPDVGNYEPVGALFAGADGMDVMRRLGAEVGEYVLVPGLFLAEMGATQEAAYKGALAGQWDTVDVVCDLQGLPRVLRAQRAGPLEDAVRTS